MKSQVNTKAQRSVFTRVILYSLLSSITAYIHSSYLISAGLQQPQIDSIYIMLSIFGIAGVWLIILKKRSITFFARAIIVFSLLLTLSLLVILSGPSSLLLIIAVFVLLGIESPLFFSCDELLEHVTRDSRTARTRSIYLILQNCCWIFAPLLGFTLIERYTDLSIVYAVGLFLALLLLGYSIYSSQHTRQEQISKPEKNKSFNTHVIPAIYSHFVLQIFYACMISIVPIYMHDILGWSWAQVGVIIASALIAFPLIQFPLGKILDKYRTEALIMPLSMVIMACAMVAFLTTQNSTTLLLPIITLFLTRVGAAALEISNESYIFRHIDYRHRSTIALFRSLSPLSYLFVPVFWFIIQLSSIQTLVEAIAGFVLTSSLVVVVLFGARNYLKKIAEN